jgi:rhamnosyltransferase subunit B
LSAPLEHFLTAGDAPIAFTPGTGHRHAARYFATALEVLRRSGRRGLFITPHAAQVPTDLSADVMWVAEAPFARLLPRLAALVHHGGIGTTAEALRAGVPQLVVPFAFDQFDNALRARRLGVAEVVLARRASVRRVRHALDRLLSSASVAQACREVAARVANGPPPGWLVAQVEHALGS